MIPEEESERLKVRRSLAFFAHPDARVTIECVDGSNKYPPVICEELLEEKNNAVFSYIHPVTK